MWWGQRGGGVHLLMQQPHCLAEFQQQYDVVLEASCKMAVAHPETAGWP